MRSILAALLLVGGILAGCSTTEDKNERRDTPVSRAAAKEDWNSMQVDPVCGHPVNPKSATGEYYAGKIYYFDSEDCRRWFHDNPTAYIPLPGHHIQIQDVR